MSSVIKLQFVKKQLVNSDVYTFYFSLPKGLKHKAGQHGLFIIPGLYRPHPFTLSSSPDEEYVTITTHVNTGSRYKKKLMSMRKGESIILIGPMFNFTFSNQANSHVFLAQGIGITPFRSMLTHAHSKSLPITTTLIHVDGKEHVFRNLTTEYATSSYYPTNTVEFQEYVKMQKPEQIFYLSGSPRFVRATRRFLLKQGVKSWDIKSDWFFGY